MRNRKKGFTLIEMLVVIAIIAILVSMILPMVTGSTVRAAAATNAANLRAIEGKLSTLRVTDSQAFENWAEDLKDSMTSEEQEAVNSMLDFWFGAGSMENLINNVGTTTAQNGILTLWSGTTINDVPVSEKMTVGDKYTSVEEGVQMSVMISDTAIKAYYGNKDTVFFSDIAEDGKYDGDVNYKNLANPNYGKDYSTSGETQQIACHLTGHQYDPEFGQCTVCGTYMPDQCSCCKTQAYTESALLKGHCNKCGHPSGAHVSSGGSTTTGCGCTGYSATNILNRKCKNCGCPEGSHPSTSYFGRGACSNATSWAK